MFSSPLSTSCSEEVWYSVKAHEILCRFHDINNKIGSFECLSSVAHSDVINLTLILANTVSFHDLLLHELLLIINSDYATGGRWTCLGNLMVMQTPTMSHLVVCHVKFLLPRCTRYCKWRKKACLGWQYAVEIGLGRL